MDGIAKDHPAARHWRELMEKLRTELAAAAKKRGDAAAALGLHRESLTGRRELGDLHGIAESLEDFALLAAAGAQPERAARLWGAAERLRKEIGSPQPPRERARA